MCYVFNSELVQLDTVRGMLDISLIYYTLLIAVCVDVTLALPHLITTIYHTQVFISSFPLALETP